MRSARRLPGLRTGPRQSRALARRDATHWSIRLRCGGCGHLREAHATDEEAKCFERDLERGAEQIAATVAMSERESMRAAAATLEAALEHDLIDPGDFCR